MVWVQKNTIPPNKTFSLSLRDFSGGLNNRSTILKDNEASDVMNMSFATDLLMEERHGVEDAGFPALSSPITHIGKFEPYNAASIDICGTENELYADGVFIYNVSSNVYAKNYMGKYVFVDGESVFQYGTFPQVSSTYEKVVGTPNPTNVVMKLVGTPEEYTPLGETHVRGVQVYDYDNFFTWYEPCELELQDTYKGANVLPDKPTYIEVHKDRLYIASSKSDMNTVFISDLSNRSYFPVYLSLQMSPNSDGIRGIKSFHDSVVVGRRHDLHAIYGNTNRTELSNNVFHIRQITSHTGFMSQSAIDVAHNHLLYLGYDGNAYALNTTKSDVDMLSTQILNVSVDFKLPPYSTPASDMSDAVSIFFNDEWYVSFNGITALFNYRLMAWTLYKYTDLEITSYFVNDYVLHMGSNIGKVLKYSEQYMDLDKPYASYWASRPLDMGEPTTYKQIREFYIVAYTFNDFNSDILLKFEIDYVDVQETFNIANQVSVWGKAVWGERFISRNINASLPIVIGRRGRYIRVIVQNGHFPSAPVTDYSGLSAYANLKEGTLVHVEDENKYYLYTNGEWIEQTEANLNQPMRVIEINGQYEFRGKR